MTTLITKTSGTANKTPTISDLVYGELATNYYDGKMFVKINRGSDTVAEVDLEGIGKLFKYIFKASDNTGVKDVTKELYDLLIVANGNPIFVPPGIYRINDLDPQTSVNLIAAPNTVKFRYNAEYQCFNLSLIHI